MECIIVQSDEVMEDNNHIELCTAKHYFKVVIEGPKENFFLSVEAEVVEENTKDEVMLPEDVC
jgi:hypothetical protein